MGGLDERRLPCRKATPALPYCLSLPSSFSLVHFFEHYIINTQNVMYCSHLRLFPPHPVPAIYQARSQQFNCLFLAET
jgi:hypothetical protein